MLNNMAATVVFTLWYGVVWVSCILTLYERGDVDNINKNNYKKLSRGNTGGVII